jgi:ribosomal protein L11 methyltransferase
MLYRLSPELVMRSRWRPYRPRPGERVLVLAAASVFPPGHPTTRLCLELLAETLAAGPEARLLDVGCGSGALLLAGVAAGARLGVGVDLSGPAVATTRENAQANGLAGVLQVVKGSTECLRGTFGVMLGNLPWAVQMELRAGYQQAGWSVDCRRTRDEWVADLPPEQSFTWVAWRLRRN